jgi:hypothetical protein
MNVAHQMIELMANAKRSHCRIKAWKLTEEQASDLADWISIIESRPKESIIMSMRWSIFSVLGVPIKLV